MTTETSSALKIALAYYDAWRNRDHSSAMKVVSDDVVSESPFGTIEGGEALHASESEFAGMLTGATLVAAFGDDTTAMLMYYTHTHPVPNVLSSKYFEVRDGKITALKGLFDKSVFPAR